MSAPRLVPPPNKFIPPGALAGLPDEPWAQALVQACNDSMSALGRMMEDNSIVLQEHANIEVLSVRVNVPSPWISPAYDNAWVDSGGADQTGRFMKHPDGVVEIQGLIKTGTINTAAFTLPAGYRPNNTLKFATESNGAYGMMSITSAGVVTPVVGNNASFAINARFLSADSTSPALTCWPVRLKLKLEQKPRIVLACKAANLSNPSLSSAVRSSPAWRFVQSADGPCVEIVNLPGLTYGDRYELTFLVIGE